MSKKIKTITKIWEIDLPSDELVDDFITRMKKSCVKMKLDFPDFITHKFTIDYSTHYSYGNEYSNLDLCMTCTRCETEKEETTRIKNASKRQKRKKEFEKIKKENEKKKMYELMKKYDIKEV